MFARSTLSSNLKRRSIYRNESTETKQRPSSRRSSEVIRHRRPRSANYLRRPISDSIGIRTIFVAFLSFDIPTKRKWRENLCSRMSNISMRTEIFDRRTKNQVRHKDRRSYFQSIEMICSASETFSVDLKLGFAFESISLVLHREKPSNFLDSKRKGKRILFCDDKVDVQFVFVGSSDLENRIDDCRWRVMFSLSEWRSQWKNDRRRQEGWSSLFLLFLVDWFVSFSTFSWKSTFECVTSSQLFSSERSFVKWALKKCRQKSSSLGRILIECFHTKKSFVLFSRWFSEVKHCVVNSV